MTRMSIIEEVWDPLGLHLNLKDLKSGKKRLSYGQFTKGRLRGSSEYYARCKAHNSIHRSRMNFRTSFSALSEWKIFKICSLFKEFLVNVVVLVEEFYYVWNLKSTP